jgi:L-threonylcarbamoyladenylate synthase
VSTNLPTHLNRWHLERAVAVLRAGGVIAYATEGVYGLGCEPLDEAAVLRVLALKGRPADKGVILIAAAYEQLRAYVAEPGGGVMEPVRASWPGPTTWVLPARRAVPRWLTGRHDSVAVRVTAHPQASALCTLYGGALVSTSANPAGRPAARTALDVRRYFGRRLDFVLPGTVGNPAHGPSEMRDALSGRVLRAGVATRGAP